MTGATISETFLGQSHTNEADDLPAAWETANCVIVTLFRPGGGKVSDQLIAPLTDELPALSVGKPELLGSTKITLVTGIWTELDVPVANAGPGVVAAVVVSGKGKCL